MATGNYLFSGTTPAAPGSALLPITGSGTLQGGNVAAQMDQFESMSVLAILQGATGGTLDVYLQMNHDGNGTAWTDIAHWPQQSAAAASTTFVWNTSRWNQAAGAGSTATGDASLAANTFIQGEWGDRLRVKVVAGAGTTAGATATIKIVANRVYPKM
ncbi:MAG: hypothetical protein NVS3B7_10080 [Candidatus Elarobacter sp.]